jgi:hypothetical protein
MVQEKRLGVEEEVGDNDLLLASKGADYRIYKGLMGF